MTLERGLGLYAVAAVALAIYILAKAAAYAFTPEGREAFYVGSGGALRIEGYPVAVAVAVVLSSATIGLGWPPFLLLTLLVKRGFRGGGKRSVDEAPDEAPPGWESAVEASR